VSAPRDEVIARVIGEHEARIILLEREMRRRCTYWSLVAVIIGMNVGTVIAAWMGLS
jgi:hypothetical protein